jgi:hypothetical protein
VGPVKPHPIEKVQKSKKEKKDRKKIDIYSGQLQQLTVIATAADATHPMPLPCLSMC